MSLVQKDTSQEELITNYAVALGGKDDTMFDPYHHMMASHRGGHLHVTYVCFVMLFINPHI